GLGTMSAGSGEWWWFGHQGGFQGFISRTVVVPAHALAVSIVTNAIDGLAPQWVTGALHVLGTFARRGAPADQVRDWAGRWWSIGSATDLVPVGSKVLAVNPAMPTPFTDASEITVSGPDTGTITLANGFASHGEAVERTRDADGEVRELILGGATHVP